MLPNEKNLFVQFHTSFLHYYFYYFRQRIIKGLYFEMDLNAAGLVIADLCVRNMHVELI